MDKKSSFSSNLLQELSIHDLQHEYNATKARIDEH
jgi:hypothetical protein